MDHTASRRNRTVFRSAIDDFAAATASWQPEDVSFLLNSYLAEMSRIAEEYGGTADAFFGDAITVSFDGHMRSLKQEALRCVLMALEMRRRMAELQSLWRGIGLDRTFAIRCGIHSGKGSVDEDATRLAEAADPGVILVSPETWKLVRNDFRADACESAAAYNVRGETRHDGAARKVFQWERLGLRVLADLQRVH